MTKLEHVGIAVADAEAAVAIIEALLGEVPYKSESVDADRVRTHFIRGGGAKLELLEALGEDSPITRFLQKRGPGLHHLAFEVDDLAKAHDRLGKAGFRLLDPAPRAGADGKSIFFVHPGETGGVLFEFCRRERSILETIVIETSSQKHIIRRAGRSARPPLLVLAHDLQDIDAFAARLEQSTYVLVVDGPFADHLPDLLTTLRVERFHLVTTAAALARVDLPETLVRSATIFIGRDGELRPISKNILLVARSHHASAAVHFWSQSPTARLVVADDDELLAMAVEKHVATVERR